MLRSIDPATGQVIREYEEAGAGKIASALELADRAGAAWREGSFADRAAVLGRAAGLLRARAAEYADVMAAEMGKPVTQGKSECEKCAWVCEWFAENGERLLASDEIPTDASRSYVAYRPLGVVLAVMPWNFPFWQVFRFAAPALMAGNAGVLKHASNVSECALAIQSVWREAGAPEGVFTTLLVGSAAVGEMIASPHVRAVTLTGSTPAGRSVAAAAGRALKKTVLELGGSDPYVVLEDADLDLAADVCAAARLTNTGQSCIAAKRFIVVDAVREGFTERFVARMRAARFGDPRDTANGLGPLARHDLRDQLHAQVRASIQRGARVLLGGEVPPGPGAYYPPTVLHKVVPGMPAYNEELFGPVAALIAARDEKDAIQIANDSSFGLGSAVFTRDLERGRRIAEHDLEAGSCFVNAQVHSDPRLPFGGIKESGYGRELAAFGIREFTNVKTIYLK
ncbi:MAG TPA: NAD-dependent succinate-semialdehyde dehydrogenase [Candidatus Eisenbacteria bacterium]|nr:NAD-dependent succinate-semialdehyde dehydrogenase [Candidatus Eisenbacteria bacterium]